MAKQATDAGAAGIVHARVAADGVGLEAARGLKEGLSPEQVAAVSGRAGRGGRRGRRGDGDEASSSSSTSPPPIAAGDLVIFAAGPAATTHGALDRVRQFVARELDLVAPNRIDLLWVTGFPMFEREEEADGEEGASRGRLVALHHPFTAPDEAALAELVVVVVSSSSTPPHHRRSWTTRASSSTRAPAPTTSSSTASRSRGIPAHLPRRGPARRLRRDRPAQGPSAGAVWVFALCARVWRAAARGVCVRARQARDAPGRGPLDQGRDRVPEDGAGPGPADAGPGAGWRGAVGDLGIKLVE